jgi:nucleoside-diphosphate-sugar epimerase
MPNILLTGGSGFLGTALLQNNFFKEALVVGRTRPKQCRYFSLVDLDACCDLTDTLHDIDVVVHVAARAHVMNEKFTNQLSRYRDINTLATLNLAEQAARAGVKRFIFISTIKVLGNQTMGGRRFTSEDRLNPQDPYSISKAEAEIGLKKIMEKLDMEVVIIRPPLVYGQGVKGNFASLLKLTSLSVPLPFGAIENRRSLVSIENLVDLICTCLDHPNAKNQTFLVSDDHDLSTPELCRLLAKAGDYKSRIFPFPRALLWSILSVIGKKAVYERLLGSMEINIELTKSQLNWKPPHRVKDSLINCWLSGIK